MPVALPPPHERPPAYLVSAIPIETLHFNIRAFLLVHPEIEIFFVQRVIPAENGLVFYHLLRPAAAMRKFPGMFGRRGIIFHVLHVATPLQHNGLQTFFGQLLRSPAPADS